MHVTTTHLQLTTRTSSDGVVDQGFTVGDVPGVLVPNTLALLAIAAVLLFALVRATRLRLE